MTVKCHYFLISKSPVLNTGIIVSYLNKVCLNITSSYNKFLIYIFTALFLMSTILPMVVGFLAKPLEDLKETDAEQFFTNPDLMTMMYREPKFIEDIRNLLPILLREGYLD